MFDILVFGMQLGDIIVGAIALAVCVAGAITLCRRDEEEVRMMFVGGRHGRR